MGEARPPRPKPNGNGFENYVVDAVRPRIFQPVITLGNVITIAGLLITGTLFYAKVVAHISDTQIHQTVDQKEEAFDRRFALRMETTSLRLQSLENAVKDTHTDVGALREQIDNQAGKLDRKLNRVLEGSPSNRHD